MSGGGILKKNRTENLLGETTLEEQSPSSDGILENLKVRGPPLHTSSTLICTWQASIAPRRFGDYTGACPLAPVFLKKGSRKYAQLENLYDANSYPSTRFRGHELPEYWNGAKDGDTTVPVEYIYMGVAMRPSKVIS